MQPLLEKFASFAGLFVLAAPMAGMAATFTPVSKSQIPDLYNSRAAWADVNQDGFLDVAITGTVSLTSNTWSSTRGSPVSSPSRGGSGATRR